MPAGSSQVSGQASLDARRGLGTPTGLGRLTAVTSQKVGQQRGAVGAAGPGCGASSSVLVIVPPPQGPQEEGQGHRLSRHWCPLPARHAGQCQPDACLRGTEMGVFLPLASLLLCGKHVINTSSLNTQVGGSEDAFQMGN